MAGMIPATNMLRDGEKTGTRPPDVGLKPEAGQASTSPPGVGLTLKQAQARQHAQHTLMRCSSSAMRHSMRLLGLTSR